MRHKHRPYLRYWLLLPLLLLIFLIVGTGTALGSAASRMLAATEQLETARNLLVSDPAQAEQLFTNASSELETASQIILAAPWYTRLLTPLPPFRWQVQLLKASHALAESGKTITTLSQSFPPIKKDADINLLLTNSSSSFFRWYHEHDTEIGYLQNQLITADTELQALPNWIALNRRATLQNLKTTVSSAVTQLPQVQSSILDLERVLGKNDPNPHTIMVLFENNAELRPSGGFGGSYALVTASGGTIRSFTFGTDIYKLDRPFEKTNPEKPVAALQTITPFLGFRDSTALTGFLSEYSPRFAGMFETASARKIDGIVYLTTSVLESLLQITGPIVIPETGETATAETIRNQLTTYVEKTYYEDDANKEIREPKSVINSLIPGLLAKLFATDGLIQKVPPILGDSVAAKHIQFWFKDPSLTDNLTNFLPSDGPTDGNWLKIVNNNIGGLKSSSSVEQHVEITQESHLFSGRLTQQVEIARSHTGTATWPDGTNTNYIEVYLPKAATNVTLPVSIGGEYIISPSVLELNMLQPVSQQPLKTDGEQWQKIGFWATTKPGETTKYRFSYTLPLDTLFSDHITYLKQAGSIRETVSVFGQTYDVDQNLNLSK